MNTIVSKLKVFVYVVQLLEDVPTGHPDRLRALIELYPKIGSELHNTVLGVCTEKIKTRDFGRDHLLSLLKKHTNSLTRSAIRIQGDHLWTQIQRESTSDVEQQQAELRKKFISGINEHSQMAHHPWAILPDVASSYS